MVVGCAAVETGCMLEKYIKYSSPSPLLLLSFASILLLLLLLRRDMHLCSLFEVLLLVLLITSILKQKEVPSIVSSFFVSVLYTAMLRTSIAAVDLGCFYFCPLDCDNPVMVVDCAAVETGCMLEK